MKARMLQYILVVAIASPTVAALSDWLPLTVGNSWSYYHVYEGVDEGYSAYFTENFQSEGHPPLIISVLRTEVIDDKTYFVLSDIPPNWPPISSLFIAGKKLRWSGDHLMERTATGEQILYRFGTVSKEIRDADAQALEEVEKMHVNERNSDFEHSIWFNYQIEFQEGNTGSRSPSNEEQSVRTFFEEGYGAIDIKFVRGFGISFFAESYVLSDYGVYENTQRAFSAVINGTAVTIDQALALSVQPTSSPSSFSWGKIKRERGQF